MEALPKDVRVAYGVLRRPLPYPDAGRLVRLSKEHPGTACCRTACRNAAACWACAQR